MLKMCEVDSGSADLNCIQSMLLGDLVKSVEDLQLELVIQIPRMCEKGRARNRKFVLVSCVFCFTFNCPVDTRTEIC